MCKILEILRSLVYYYINKEENPSIQKFNETLEKDIKKIFKANNNIYRARKIKVKLKERGLLASRRKIIRIMQKNNLVERQPFFRQIYSEQKYSL